MPKQDPDLEDPLSLDAVVYDDPTGASTRQMAESFADEFLRLGHSPGEVLDLFRSSEHQLPYHAWSTLGEVAIYTLVQELAREREQLRLALRRARGGNDA